VVVGVVADPDVGVEDFEWLLQPVIDAPVSADATITPPITG
jgi:hypothetical protein